MDADSNLSNEADDTLMTAGTTGLRVVDVGRRDDDAFDNVTENVPITVDDEVVSLRQDDSMDADSNLSNEADDTLMTAGTTGLRVVDVGRRDDDAFDNVTENVPITVEGS